MPIRIAIIAPVSHMNTFVPYGDKIAMALTHLVLANEEYATFYRELRDEFGFHIILDNSAFELEQQGKGLDPEPVLEAAQKINASEVICTDVLCNYWATIESTQNFIEHYYKIWPDGPEGGGPKMQAVVQGDNEEDWWVCYGSLMRMPEINVLGFSKVSIPHCFHGNRKDNGCVTQSRLKVSETINNDPNMLPLLHGKTIHLLGGDNWSPYELSIQTRYRWVRSNDTSMPVWYGAQGEFVDLRTGKIADIITTKPDLENNDPATKDLCENALVPIMHNIIALQRFSKWHAEV